MSNKFAYHFPLLQDGRATDGCVVADHITAIYENPHRKETTIILLTGGGMIFVAETFERVMDELTNQDDK